MTGETWFGSLIRACDLAVELNVLIMLAFYIRALISMQRQGTHNFARNLCMGIVVGWAGNAVLFGNLVYVYTVHHLDPMISPALPSVRLIYVVLVLTGCSMHIATSLATGGQWWRTLLLWMAVTGCLIMAATALDLRGII